jgi:hypothetical protein
MIENLRRSLFIYRETSGFMMKPIENMDFIEVNNNTESKRKRLDVLSVLIYLSFRSMNILFLF